MSDDLIVDLTNYKDRVGNRVIPGRYTVLVEDAESDTAKSGNAMVNLWLRVQGGDFDGATIIDRLVLTEKSLFRVVGFMQAVGLPTPKKKFKINVRQFTGRTLDIDVDDGEPYNGRVKSEVKGYMRSTGGAAASSEASDLDDLDTEDTTESDSTVASAAPAEAAPAAEATKAEDGDVIDIDAIDLDSIDL